MTYFNKNRQQWEDCHAFWTASEIVQQPETWDKTICLIQQKKSEINAFLATSLNSPEIDVIFTGAGTSEFIGNTLVHSMNYNRAYRCHSVASTDLISAPESYLSNEKPILLISFGRSGNSPESLGAIQAAEAVSNKVRHLIITCNIHGAIAKWAEQKERAYVIQLDEKTHDQAFAMTSSFTNMYLAALLCMNLNQLDEINERLQDGIKSVKQFLHCGYQVIEKLVDSYDFRRIVYLGSQALKGISQESALKMLELTSGKIPVAYDSPLGFRHGPKSILDDSTLTVIYLSDDAYAYQYELDLLKEMSAQRKGNKILAVSNLYREEIEGLADEYISFEGKFQKNEILAIETILVGQTLALFKSLSLKITTDNPCPTKEVNRVVEGVTIYPYRKQEGLK